MSKIWYPTLRGTVSMLLALNLLGCVYVEGESVKIQRTYVSGNTGSEHDLVDLRTVDGAIYVLDDMRVRDIRNINGVTVVESNGRARNLNAVNGNIRVRGESLVTGHIKNVSGDVMIDGNSNIKGTISTTSGDLTIANSMVNERVTTSHGNVSIHNSRLNGDLMIRNRPNFFSPQHPKVVIGPNSSIQGSIIAPIKTEILIHTSSSVGGIAGPAPIFFD